jgi:diacylglycerol kinase
VETIHKSGRAGPARALTLLASFGYAFEGIRYLIATQRNAKIHVAIGMIAVIAGVMLHISRVEWLALVVMIALVLTLEGVNTAVEALVDLACPHYHPLAKVAKDVGAGMVLLAAIASVVVGLIIFWPRVWPLLLGWF